METQILCYVCMDCETESNPYAKEPCICKGSIIIHEKCLKTIINKSRICSICKQRYNLKYLPQKNGRELIVEKLKNNNIIEYTVNEKGEKHGTYKVIGPEGNTKTVHSYIDGIMEGPYCEYYSNGQIKVICSCKNNKLQGHYIEWFSDGSIKEESYYMNGKKHGESVEWIQDGFIRISNIIQYEDGEPV